MSETYDLPEPPHAVVIHTYNDFDVWIMEGLSYYTKKVATFSDGIDAINYARILNNPECKKCGTDLDLKGFCQDDTCPFSSYQQDENWSEEEHLFYNDDRPPQEEIDAEV